MDKFILKFSPEQEAAIFAFIGLVVQGVLGLVSDGKPLTLQGLALVLLAAVGSFVTSKARQNGDKTSN